MSAALISRFTPSLLSHDALEATFVQRHDLARRLVDLIGESARNASKHHTLLVGPRGIGKTHIVSVVYHRVRADKKLDDRLTIAWLREEEWGVTSFFDVLLRVLRALTEQYPDTGLSKKVEGLYALAREDAEREAARILEEFVGERTLLVLIENLDDLFTGIRDEGQKRLRAYVQEKPYWTILATAQGLFGGVSRQTSAFYGFFRIEHLAPLELDEAVELLSKMARHRGDHELASLILTPIGRARVRAVHHLAGGNHRVYVILSEFLTGESLDALVEPLMHTIDDLTPYYQSRMNWLSPQQRKIVELLCDRRGALQVKEIAKACFLSHQSTSSQLKALRDVGYVTSSKNGRESYYELSEPLMRLCMQTKKQRGQTLWILVELLRLWYTPGELKRRLRRLTADIGVESKVLRQAIDRLSRETEDPRVAACMRDISAYLDRHDYARMLQVAEELVEINENPLARVLTVCALALLQRYEDALRLIEDSSALHSDCPDLLVCRGSILCELERFEDAVTAFSEALEHTSDLDPAWEDWARALAAVGRLDEAVEAYEKAIEADPTSVSAWGNRGAALGQLQRLEEAKVCFDKVIELEPRNALGWCHRGQVLAEQGRHGRALAALDKAIELNRDLGDAWASRAEVYRQIGDLFEAVGSWDNAIKCGEAAPTVVFNRLAALSRLGQWDSVLSAAQDALRVFEGDAGTLSAGTGQFLISLLTKTDVRTAWPQQIPTLVDLYRRHRMEMALAVGVLFSIAGLREVDDDIARAWHDAWRAAASELGSFEIALRLLDSAVRYRDHRNQRVLLELPREERTVLKQLLAEQDEIKLTLPSRVLEGIVVRIDRKHEP